MRKLKNKELGRLDVEGFRNAPKIPVILVLDDVRSAYNVGSVFRTADAFRVEKIFLCGITGAPPNREILKTALGATESVSWEYVSDIREVITGLKGLGYSVFAFEQVENSIKLHDFIPEGNRKYALVFGHEVFGVKQDILNMCDGCLEIPQFGTKHSFNITVSAGIALWDISNKLHLKWQP